VWRGVGVIVGKDETGEIGLSSPHPSHESSPSSGLCSHAAIQDKNRMVSIVILAIMTYMRVVSVWCVGHVQRAYWQTFTGHVARTALLSTPANTQNTHHTRGLFSHHHLHGGIGEQRNERNGETTKTHTETRKTHDTYEVMTGI
jgi:hypothetical protein